MPQNRWAQTSKFGGGAEVFGYKFRWHHNMRFDVQNRNPADDR